MNFSTGVKSRYSANDLHSWRTVRIINIRACSSMYSYCCICILIVVYVFLDAATLTEGFPCFFLGCKANAWVILAKTGHGPHSSKIVVFVVYIVCFLLFYILFVCKCVLPPGDNPTAVNKYIIITSFTCLLRSSQESRVHEKSGVNRKRILHHQPTKKRATDQTPLLSRPKLCTYVHLDSFLSVSLLGQEAFSITHNEFNENCVNTEV